MDRLTRHMNLELGLQGQRRVSLLHKGKELRTEVHSLVGKESQVLVGSILDYVRVRRPKQSNQNIGKNQGGEEVPRIVDDQAKGITESAIRRVEIGRSA